ncbi:hypothetical protein MVEN_01667200 [Mycena venus]|uniref:Uncharacterized protein n=1 Tax=Mycena venus TaxID=2733690 RepID=A0A8H7CRQ2_9AGAR|nr:hypothetical protein MVEN_01667200 [Mycena venus]
MVNWAPTPLLIPPKNLSLAGVRFEGVTCSWPGERLAPPVDLEKGIGVVIVGDQYVIFLDKQTQQPVFVKKIVSLSKNPTTARGSNYSLVTLNCRPNVRNDFEVDINFPSNKLAKQFVDIVGKRTQEHGCSLETAIFLLQPRSPAPSQDDTTISNAEPGSPASDSDSDADTDVRTAHLLQGSTRLHEAVADVLTALAYTESADILGPLVDWDIRPDVSFQQRRNRIKQIQTRFQTEHPPLILVLDGQATRSNSPLPDTLIWDAETSSPFVAQRRIPSPPTWPGPGAPPNTWLDFQLQNHRIHTRDNDKMGPRYIALSYELVDFFHAACEAHDAAEGDESERWAARESLDAAIGCLKGMLIHGLAHLWVAETTGKSPPRDRVVGASDSFFDLIEDQDNPGYVEAGYLVETAWLGCSLELAVDQSGWLKLAVRQVEVKEEKPSTSVEAGESQLTRLTTRPAHFEPTVSVGLCDKDIVAEFRKPGIPLFPGGIAKNMRRVPTAPTQRLKTSRLPSTPPCRDPEAGRLTLREKAGVLCGSSLPVPAVVRAKGVAWPKVSERK